MKTVHKRLKSFTLSIIVICVLLLAVVPAASATLSIWTAALITPTDINNVHPGDTVTIRITDLSSGDEQFWTELKNSTAPTDLATNGGTITWTNFNMPFGFGAGSSTTVKTTGVSGTTTLSVTDKDDTVYTKTDGGTGTISSTKEITQQIYKTISISGTPSASTVGIDYKVGGTSVTGADSSSTYDLTFTLNGINTGHLQILVSNATTTKLDKTLTIVPVPVNNNDASGGDSGFTPPLAFGQTAVPTPVIITTTIPTTPTVPTVSTTETPAVTSSPTPFVYQTIPTVVPSTTSATIARTTVPPQPTPTKSPMVPGILVIGVIGFVGYFIAHKKV
ncbi:MAG: hypothetical protein NTZ39_05695 [Methanoregula sp.]|nr:hypothetical protein [Methanoregula sp.]